MHRNGSRSWPAVRHSKVWDPEFIHAGANKQIDDSLVAKMVGPQSTRVELPLLGWALGWACLGIANHGANYNSSNRTTILAQVNNRNGQIFGMKYFHLRPMLGIALICIDKHT